MNAGTHALEIKSDVYLIEAKAGIELPGNCTSDYLNIKKTLYAFRCKTTTSLTEEIIITDLKKFYVFSKAKNYYNLVNLVPRSIIPDYLQHKNFGTFKIL
jgi:hypothetical protein